MKKMKKLAVFLFTLCLGIQCTWMTSHAAEGTLAFSDPTVKAGATVEVTVKMTSAGEEPVGSGQAEISYDTSYLEFISGRNASGGDGTVTLNAEGDGTKTELFYTMKFKALQEGETQIEAVSATSYLYDTGEEMFLALGDSTVTIEPGDESTANTGDRIPIELEGKKYTISGDFSDTAVPDGFERSMIPYEGKNAAVLVHKVSGQKMIYLEREDGAGEFFLYDNETDEFTAFEKIDLSDSAYIFITDDKGRAKVPGRYEKTTIQMDDKVFPAWQNVKDNNLADFFLVYAVDNSGKGSMYQYDSVQNTYQRYVSTLAANGEKEQVALSKMTSFIDRNLSKLLVAVWGIFLLMLAAIIALAVKVRNLNEELDELYLEEDDEEDEGERGDYDDDAYDDDDEFYDDDDEYYDDDEFYIDD